MYTVQLRILHEEQHRFGKHRCRIQKLTKQFILYYEIVHEVHDTQTYSKNQKQ